MICENCGYKKATELHHKFSQTKLNKKLYPEFIHHRDNLQELCYDCHHNKPVTKWTEIEFCEHFKIMPRTKSGYMTYLKRNGVQYKCTK